MHTRRAHSCTHIRRAHRLMSIRDTHHVVCPRFTNTAALDRDFTDASIRAGEIDPDNSCPLSAVRRAMHHRSDDINGTTTEPRGSGSAKGDP